MYAFSGILGECAPPKGGCKPRRVKAWDPGNRRCNRSERWREFLEWLWREFPCGQFCSEPGKQAQRGAGGQRLLEEEQQKKMKLDTWRASRRMRNYLHPPLTPGLTTWIFVYSECWMVQGNLAIDTNIIGEGGEEEEVEKEERGRRGGRGGSRLIMSYLEKQKVKILVLRLGVHNLSVMIIT